jgi:ATP-dependent helicase/nuclease subunit A
MRALTDEQEQAVARRGEPLLLSAAAGSGKTSVLVERFVRGVLEDGVAPGRILAITFTERAAGELRERVRARFLELGEREAARDTEAAFVGTFHGFCARLLRSHPLMAGLDPDFTILDEGLAGRLRERAFSAALKTFVRDERPAAVDLLAAYGVDRVHTMVAAVHAQLRSRGQRLPRLPAPTVAPGDIEPEDAAAIVACTLLDELLAGFGDAYEQLKQARSAVDFDDLELCARQLLDERDSVRAAWSQRFELLMVDEFQDTNPRQLAILRALDRDNLFTVGDELQSIYGFRHADVSLFRARRAELAERGASLALRRNFRSRAELLDVVNAAFAERFLDFAPLVAGREEPPAVEQPRADEQPAVEEPRAELLLTSRSGWEENESLAAQVADGLPTAPLWRQAEARLLAQRVAELIDGGHARAGDIVLLLRAVGDLDVYERALQLCGVRTLAAVGGFWEHQQVGDLLAYLRALANPLDEEALYSTLAGPLAGVSLDGLALLARVARESRRGVWEIALAASEPKGPPVGLSERDGVLLAAFCARLRSERSAASRRTISQLLVRAIDAAGYREHVLGLQWGQRRLANIHKLLRLAVRFEVAEGRDLRAFLDHVAHLRDAHSSAEPDAPVDGVEPDAVRLMTIHAAKGLEFPVVCVADLGRAQNTRVGDLLVDGERVGLQLARLDGAKPVPALDYERLCEERRAAEAEEEDRIVYVATTRARERLILSGAVDFDRWPLPRAGASTISWLGPALSPELPALVQTGEEHCFDWTVGEAHVRCWLSSPRTIGAVLRLDPASPTDGDEGQRAPSTVRDKPGGGSLPVPVSVPVPAASAASVPDRASSASSAEPGIQAATLSYTALSELERCAYRYYLERVLGLREDRAAARAQPGERGGLEARARGTLVHKLLESLDFARPEAPAPEDVARAARELGMRAGREEREEISMLIDAALDSALAARVAGAASVSREHPFAFSLAADEPLIVGVVDLLVRETDGGVLVLDYKSDRVGADVDLGALVERDYGIQRLLYALAVLREDTSSVEVVHWFLQRAREPVVAHYAASDRDALEHRLAERLVQAHERMRTFSVSPQPHRGLCLTCPGRGGLCSWGEMDTMRDDPLAGLAVGAQLRLAP